MMKRIILIFILLCNELVAPLSFANEFPLPPWGGSLIGETLYTSGSEPLANVGVRYNVGMNALINANPGLTDDSQYYSGCLKVPAEFILPPLARKGIVINLPEMRMYYYPTNSNTVMTFPIGIGRIGKTIPTANTFITKKVVNPTWIPPEDIRAFNKEKGVNLPRVMGPGPDNPLGPYAIYLQLPTYLIHSTIFPESIGRRASFGCIRMHENDIKQFFPLVTPGTPVTIVDMPNKVGWSDNLLFLEAHPPLQERSNSQNATIGAIVDSIQHSVRPNELALINWQTVSYLAEQRDGVPHEIGIKLIVNE